MRDQPLPWPDLEEAEDPPFLPNTLLETVAQEDTIQGMLLQILFLNTMTHMTTMSHTMMDRL